MDADISAFFDRISHAWLLRFLEHRIGDKRILRLIQGWLKAGVLDQGRSEETTEGIPQGSVISPLLSNLLWDDLDRDLERRGHYFVHYADDCNVYVAFQAAGKRVLHSTEPFLNAELRLSVNRSKSAVDHPWKRNFLRYTVTPHRPPAVETRTEKRTAAAQTSPRSNSACARPPAV